MSLFESGSFKLHSGSISTFKIECDALSFEDWRTLASIVARKFQFREVIGIPTGGLLFAEVLKPYAESGTELPLLIVDDVLTTGNSFLEMRAKIAQDTLGVVVFARGPCPSWVYPIFRMSEEW